MIRKKATIVSKNILFSFIPSVLAYLSKSDNFLNKMQNEGYIGQNIDIAALKDISLICSIALTFILLTINLIRYECDKNYFLKQRNELLGFNKKIFMSVLEEEMSIKNLNMDLRIFVPKKRLLSFGKNRKIEFEIKNIDIIADAGLTNNLKFEVYPNPQGLVGECYNSKQMIYDTDLKNTNATEYNLTKYQIDKTHDLRFSLCCPILNTKGNVI